MPFTAEEVLNAAISGEVEQMYARLLSAAEKAVVADLARVLIESSTPRGGRTDDFAAVDKLLGIPQPIASPHETGPHQLTSR